MLTAELEEHEALEAARLGVQGVVLKAMAAELLVECVHTVYDGGHWFERHTVNGRLATILRHEADRRTMVWPLNATRAGDCAPGGPRLAQ